LVSSRTESRGQRFKEKAIEASSEAGAALLRGVERWLIRYSLVDTTPFLPRQQFAWAAALEAETPAIKAELEKVLERRDDLPNFQDISIDQASITDDDRWKTYFFFGYGFKSESNCARCPATTAALERVPGLTTAFFSILSPGKHIPEHRGPWRGVVRSHLALMVPPPVDASGISVGGEVTHWQEGTTLFFDDTFEHFAWNDTDGVRVVLFMDVLRPLRPPAKQVNRALIKAIAFSPYVQDAKSRHLAWERRFERLTAR
jgi:beta-hydroxylase